MQAEDFTFATSQEGKEGGRTGGGAGHAPTPPNPVQQLTKHGGGGTRSPTCLPRIRLRAAALDGGLNISPPGLHGGWCRIAASAYAGRRDRRAGVIHFVFHGGKNRPGWRTHPHDRKPPRATTGRTRRYSLLPYPRFAHAPLPTPVPARTPAPYHTTPWRTRAAPSRNFR